MDGLLCFLPCTYVTIGNYVQSVVHSTAHVIEFNVHLPFLQPQEVITIAICVNDILKVLAHFGKSTPSFFIVALMMPVQGSINSLRC